MIRGYNNSNKIDEEQKVLNVYDPIIPKMLFLQLYQNLDHPLKEQRNELITAIELFDSE